MNTYHKARISILHSVLSFSISHTYDESGRRYPGSVGFISDRVVNPQPGDLVVLTSAPASKWQIGWLRKIETFSGGNEYTIESLEDQSLCRWSNVGIETYPRDRVIDCWRWSDKQWAFKERWFKVCYKDNDAYIVRPRDPEFGEGYAVTLGTRTSHGMDDIRPSRSFSDWRKVTKKMMDECYKSCVQERDAIKPLFLNSSSQ